MTEKTEESKPQRDKFTFRHQRAIVIARSMMTQLFPASAEEGVGLFGFETDRETMTLSKITLQIDNIGRFEFVIDEENSCVHSMKEIKS